MLRPIYSREMGPQYPLTRSSNGSHSRSGSFGNEKESFALQEIEATLLGSAASIPVTTPTQQCY
jgi:hypothetical protein